MSKSLLGLDLYERLSKKYEYDKAFYNDVHYSKNYDNNKYILNRKTYFKVRDSEDKAIVLNKSPFFSQKLNNIFQLLAKFIRPYSNMLGLPSNKGQESIPITVEDFAVINKLDYAEVRDAFSLFQVLGIIGIFNTYAVEKIFVNPKYIVSNKELSVTVFELFSGYEDFERYVFGLTKLEDKVTEEVLAIYTGILEKHKNNIRVTIEAINDAVRDLDYEIIIDGIRVSRENIEVLENIVLKKIRGVVVRDSFNAIVEDLVHEKISGTSVGKIEKVIKEGLSADTIEKAFDLLTEEDLDKIIVSNIINYKDPDSIEANKIKNKLTEKIKGRKVYTYKKKGV